eukprot:g15404.t1
MITQIAHYPEYRPEDPSDDYPTYWVTFYSRKGAVRCSRVGEVPDPAVQGGRLVIRQGPKPFPKVPMHPDLGKQPQAAPNPRSDPATTKGNDPSPPEIPEATASLKEPTTSQNQNLPQPEIPPAKGIEAPAIPPSTHPSLPTGSLRKTTSPAQPSAPHIFEGVTRKSRSKSPPTVRADSDDEIDLEHLINGEAEGWRLEQEEKRQQSRNTPPPPTTPTPDKDKKPPPQHAPPPGRTYNPIPEIGSNITQILKLRADFGEHRQCLLTNHILSPPGPQDISRQITRFLRQRSYYKHVLTPLLLTSPRRRWTLLILSKTLKRELVGTTFGQTPSLRPVPSRNNPLIIWLHPNTYQLQGPTLPIQQEVKDWISALGTAEVIHKKVELGVVAGPLNHTAGTEEDLIELHVKTFLSSPSGYQAWIHPRDQATPNPPQNPAAQGTRPPTDRPACQLTTGGHAGDTDSSDTSRQGASTTTSAGPARGILPITGMPGETGKISPSARIEPQDALNNERPQPARNRAGMLTLSTMRDASPGSFHIRIRGDPTPPVANRSPPTIAPRPAAPGRIHPSAHFSKTS